MIRLHDEDIQIHDEAVSSEIMVYITTTKKTVCSIIVVV